MTVLPNHIYFEARATFVSAQGTWTKTRDKLILEQTVICPFFARSTIRTCVRQTLEDLGRI